MEGYELATRTSAAPSGPWMWISCARLAPAVSGVPRVCVCWRWTGGGWRGAHLAVCAYHPHALRARDPRVDEVQELDDVAEELLAATTTPSE